MKSKTFKTQLGELHVSASRETFDGESSKLYIGLSGQPVAKTFSPYDHLKSVRPDILADLFELDFRVLSSGHKVDIEWVNELSDAINAFIALETPTESEFNAHEQYFGI